MKDDDLKKLLGQCDVPDLDDRAKERIATLAVGRYRDAERAPKPKPEMPSRSWLAAGFKPAFALAVCVVVIVGQRFLSDRDPNAIATPVTDKYAAAVFAEYRSLFQDELKALVAHNGDVDVVLGGQGAAQRNPLVVIRIEVDGKPVYITAFSGQTIEADIGGKRVTLEILTTTDQGVVLASDEFLLEDGVLHGPEGFNADAHVLETRL